METLAFARDDGVTRLPVNSSRAMPASTTAAISLITTVHPVTDHLMHVWRASLLRVGLTASCMRTLMRLLSFHRHEFVLAALVHRTHVQKWWRATKAAHPRM